MRLVIEHVRFHFSLDFFFPYLERKASLECINVFRSILNMNQNRESY